ncbi:hypothetical protein C5167_026430 [Papaver somniferum]|nr:hypothetical protein C5167_026430 [Papaver somniferum]
MLGGFRRIRIRSADVGGSSGGVVVQIE